MTDPYMESDEPTGYDENASPRWWSRDTLLEPRAGALLAFALGFASLLIMTPAEVIFEVAREDDPSSIRWDAVAPGIHLFVAVVAAIVAVWVIARSRATADWSGAVARAALGVAGMSIVLNLSAFGLALAQGSPSFNGFSSVPTPPSSSSATDVPAVPTLSPCPSSTPPPDVVCVPTGP